MAGSVVAASCWMARSTDALRSRSALRTAAPIWRSRPGSPISVATKPAFRVTNQPASGGFHHHRIHLAPEKRLERLVGRHVDFAVVSAPVDQLITERHRLDADDPGFEILERADAADTRGDHDLAHDIVRRGQAQPGLVVHEARGDGKAHDEVAPTLVELPEHDDLPRGGNPVDRQLRLERRRDGAGDLDLEARLPGVPTGERQVRRIRAQPEPPNLAGAARGRDQDDCDHEPPHYSHSLSPKTTTTSLKFSLVA